MSTIADQLAGALRNVLPFVVTDVLEHCDGNKCRESWCAGCMGEEDAAANVKKAMDEYSASSKVLAAYEASRTAPAVREVDNAGMGNACDAYLLVTGTVCSPKGMMAALNSFRDRLNGEAG